MKERRSRLTNALFFLLGLNGLYLVVLLLGDELGTIPKWAFGSVFKQSLPMMVLTRFIVSPILEELFFRRLLLNKMDRSGFAYGNLVQALIFALLHAEPIKLLNTFMGGLVLGNVYRRERKIIYSIAVHAVYNLLGTMLGWAILTLRGSYGMAVYGIAVAIAGIVIFITWKKKTYAMLSL